MAETLAKLGAVVWLRLRLQLRQKLGWISILIGVLLVFISMVVANVSFVSPAKIFWDFSLGVIFLLQVGLAIFLGSQLYNDEKNRRTLHLLLSSGVSRGEWLGGNVLGIWLGLSLMNFFWFFVTVIVSHITFSISPFMMALQATVLLSFEVLIVVLLSVFASLFLRPLLALSGPAILVFFLHSLSSIQRIFTDPQVGRFVDNRGASYVLFLGRFFPPLEWFDLKTLVGYESHISGATFFALVGLALLWSGLLMFSSWLRFEKMDL